MKKLYSAAVKMIIAFSLVWFDDVMLAQAQNTDSAAIKEAIMNYVEGFYTGNTQRMEKAIHPELAKRVIIKDKSGATMLDNMGSSTLIFNTSFRSAKKDTTGIPFKADIIVYEIFKNVATAKVTTNKFKFIDYVQLGKINGEWKIINVLWEFIEK